ncbi:MAG: hypothetical protein H8D23_00020 [Candidatus Brocadiales bacterium]|nr:hypothetical protein [Candidatus Brocadiales bacterium]
MDKETKPVLKGIIANYEQMVANYESVLGELNSKLSDLLPNEPPKELSKDEHKPDDNSSIISHLIDLGDRFNNANADLKSTLTWLGRYL